MTRLLGAALLVAAGFLTGGAATQQIKCKVKLLYTITDALQQLRRELSTREPPYDVLFASLECLPGETGRFFAGLREDERTLRARWEAAVETELSALSEPCRRVLLSLGTGLGQSMTSEQLRLLDSAIDALQQAYVREEKTAREQAALWRKLCPGVAATLALLLL